MTGKKPIRYNGQNKEKTSVTGSVYKKIAGLADKYFSLLKRSDSAFILSLFSFLDLLLLSRVPLSFRSTLGLFILTATILTLRLRNGLSGFFLTAIFVFPLFNPNKYYLIESIRHQNLIRGVKTELLLGYGVNLTNIFLFMSLVALIRNFLIQKLTVPEYAKKLLFFVTLLPAGLFFISGLIGSVYNSPFPVVSTTWLTQYLQLFLTAALVLLFFITDKRRFRLVFDVVLISSVLEIVLSFWQFIRQNGVGIPIESTPGSQFAMGLDENNAFYRVIGTMLYHNQLALILGIYLTILLPMALKYISRKRLIGPLFLVITIVLTQSRSVWIGLLMAGTVLFAAYHRQLKRVFSFIGNSRLVIYGSVLALLFSIIIVPRILLSANAGAEGAGIPVRLKMIREGIEALGISPWFGYGAGTNEYVLFNQFPNGVISTFPAAIHQSLIQILLEAGIIGTLIILFPFIYLVRTELISLINGNIVRHSSYCYSFLAGGIIIFCYYLFQPHVGIIEFPFLGLILGFGLIDVYLLRSGEKNEKMA